MHVSFMVELDESITTWFATLSIDDYMHLITHIHHSNAGKIHKIRQETQLLWTKCVAACAISGTNAGSMHVRNKYYMVNNN